ncbi:protein MIS12-like [Melia azedarach]|nr:protein MIS12-like [Melia azedarach]
MEGSESEAVFNSLNLNPQLFINETLNTVDDLVDDAFSFYFQQASTLLKTEGTDRSQDLSKGVAYIRNMIQSALDKRLDMWKKYCHHHCFAVPEGFSLPKTNELPGESSMCEDALNDSDLDAQLDSLRDKLSMVGKESAELNRQLRSLEKQSSASGHCAALADEALQLYDQNSMHDLFQEMVKTASELRMKMDNLKARRMEDIQRTRAERVYSPKRDFCTMNRSKGLLSTKLEDLQEILADLKNM